MNSVILENYQLRKSFSKIPEILEPPDLIELQKKSYAEFLQKNVKPEQRKPVGIEGAMRSVFPIEAINGKATLEYVKYELEEPKFSPDECRLKGLTYSAPMKVTVRLIVWDILNEETGERRIKDVKEQEVYFGDIPLMTENATFIINGTEKVVVSQLHRSCGVFFEYDKLKTKSHGRPFYTARIIPNRGSWLDFEFDHKGIMYVRIDRKKKIPVTVLLKAIGFNQETIIRELHPIEKVKIENGVFYKEVNPEVITFQRPAEDIVHPKTGEIIAKKNRRINRKIAKNIIEAGIKYIAVSKEFIVGKISPSEIYDPSTGKIIVGAGKEITEEHLKQILECGIKEFEIAFIDNLNVSSSIIDTLRSEKVKNKEMAMVEIYKKMRPGEPPSIEAAENFINSLFFDPQRYDLSKVGRLKMNKRLNLNIPMDVLTLTKEDIMATVKYLFNLKDGKGYVDDIDHLANRRVRAVGELVENYFRAGLVRMQRLVRDKLGFSEIETLMPNDIVNFKPVMGVLREFFATGQLCQFLDQVDPLSELTHKRRLSALGPGGLSRERAGFEVRDVHPSHYGKICPVETPEGPNIGLITSLATYARVNELGFIETPYLKVINGKVTKEVVYLSALDEENYVIAQANTLRNEKGEILEDNVVARVKGEIKVVPKEQVNLIDLSPSQLVGVSAALIPFLGHDDANRALMGSNMQRQAVPLMVTEAPLVGTGLEYRVIKDSGYAVTAKRGGVVEYADGQRIVVKVNEDEGGGVDIYNLVKFRKLNQNTCFNQKPIVKKGDVVKKGQILADGPASDKGELALGKNLLVAIMPWNGYNFEDAIVISERLVREDVFTSIHIEEFECIARETKLGPEEITRDIPGLSEEALANLDESGIIRIGAEVKPGDVLVGKITPKEETYLTPEEKLLRAIFGEKASDVKDTSLRVPPGITGTVIGTTVLTRRGLEKDSRLKTQEELEIARLEKDRDDELRVVDENYMAKIKMLLRGQKVKSPFSLGKKVILKAGAKITDEIIEKIPYQKLLKLDLDDEQLFEKLEELVNKYDEQRTLINTVYKEKISRLRRGEELPPGVLKIVKVSVAVKRKIQVGDKLAGRHGNKGVISKIVPIEDMPYLEDGTPVDIVLNPLGVPSRMNIGQLLELQLGWAARELGKKIGKLIDENAGEDVLRRELLKIYDSDGFRKIVESLDRESLIEIAKELRRGVPVKSPVFDGASEDEIRSWMRMAGLPENSKVKLYDGKTGEPFHFPVTVGYMYIMKLIHMVDDKIHARSTGPYSLITQQPLGGKARFGGQRLGEMEVWALEAYGAAYSLQEFLTVKSDDVAGRSKMFESIIKGKLELEPGLPESFNVLIKELQGLCLDVQLLEKEDLIELKKELESLKEKNKI